ncbi:hypothetical protein Daus18300_001710 [Diaporthe australafricana]|uniref:Peptidase A1 domain-containing protein n=1 Tax=Diaporthe australafricana TaxID=127596 RepID=A0ABR3XV44_9PEZI
MPMLVELALLIAIALPVVASSFEKSDQDTRPTLNRGHSAHIAPLAVQRSRGSYYVEARTGTPARIVDLQLRNDAGTTIFVPPKSGSLLFGAVDKNKYSGSLTILDFVHTESSSRAPTILLSHLKASSHIGHKALMTYDDNPYLVAINLGVEFSFLPQNIAEAIWQEAGAEYLEACGCPAVPCALTESYNTFTYGFGGTDGPQIEMHLWTMVIDRDVYDLQLDNTNGEPLCVFSVKNATNPASYAVGEDFLRNAYVVFDMSNDKIALAQGRFDSDALHHSDVVLFTEYGAHIPSAQGASEQPAAEVVSGTQITMNTLGTTVTNPYPDSSKSGVVIRADSSASVNESGNHDALGKDDAFNLTGDLGTWLSIVLVTLVGLAIAYTVNYQRKSAKSQTKPLSEEPSMPDPTLQESGIELEVPISAAPSRESESRGHLQESRVAAQDIEIAPTSTYMSPAVFSPTQDGDEEPKSLTFPSEAKLKSQMPEEKVLGTWSDLRKTYL